MKDLKDMTTSELIIRRSEIEHEQRALHYECGRAVREQDTELSNALHALKDHYHAEELRLNNEHRAKRQALRDEEYRQKCPLATEHAAIDAELASRNATKTDEQ